jgi:hypothetical protein
MGGFDKTTKRAETEVTSGLKEMKMTIKSTMARCLSVGIIVLVSMVLTTGCSALKSKKAPSSSTPSPASTVAAPQSKSVYLDFGDVLLPKRLKVDRSNSFVFSTSGFTAGLLSLKGRVEVNSLITFFQNKMPVDGWQLISAIKASRSMLLFKKQSRWCVISITEGKMSTRTEIWVAPTLGGPK